MDRAIQERYNFHTEKNSGFYSVWVAVTREGRSGWAQEITLLPSLSQFVGKEWQLQSPRPSHVQGGGYPTRGMAALHPAQRGKKCSVFSLVP